MLYDKEKLQIIAVPCHKDLSNFTIPDSVEIIEGGAITSNPTLTSIVIPQSVNQIGESAFACCENLTSVTMSDAVTELNESIFACCESLVSIDIPQRVTAIGQSVFFNCHNLTEVHCHIKDINNVLIDNSVFDQCELSQCTLLVPDGTVDDYKRHPLFSQFKEIVIDND